MSNNISKNKGFTLVELMIVISITAILLAIGTVSYRRYLVQLSVSQAAEEISITLNTTQQKAITLGMKSGIYIYSETEYWVFADPMSTADFIPYKSLLAAVAIPPQGSAPLSPSFLPMEPPSNILWKKTLQDGAKVVWPPPGYAIYSTPKTTGDQVTGWKIVSVNIYPSEIKAQRVMEIAAEFLHNTYYMDVYVDFDGKFMTTEHDKIPGKYALGGSTQNSPSDGSMQNPPSSDISAPEPSTQPNYNPDNGDLLDLVNRNRPGGGGPLIPGSEVFLYVDGVKIRVQASFLNDNDGTTSTYTITSYMPGLTNIPTNPTVPPSQPTPTPTQAATLPDIFGAAQARSGGAGTLQSYSAVYDIAGRLISGSFLYPDGALISYYLEDDGTISTAQLQMPGTPMPTQPNSNTNPITGANQARQAGAGTLIPGSATYDANGELISGTFSYPAENMTITYSLNPDGTLSVQCNPLPQPTPQPTGTSIPPQPINGEPGNFNPQFQPDPNNPPLWFGDPNLTPPGFTPAPTDPAGNPILPGMTNIPPANQPPIPAGQPIPPQPTSTQTGTPIQFPINLIPQPTATTLETK